MSDGDVQYGTWTDGPNKDIPWTSLRQAMPVGCEGVVYGLPFRRCFCCPVAAFNRCLYKKVLSQYKPVKLGRGGGLHPSDFILNIIFDKFEKIIY